MSPLVEETVIMIPGNILAPDQGVEGEGGGSPENLLPSPISSIQSNPTTKNISRIISLSSFVALQHYLFF